MSHLSLAIFDYQMVKLGKLKFWTSGQSQHPETSALRLLFLFKSCGLDAAEAQNVRA